MNTVSAPADAADPPAASQASQASAASAAASASSAPPASSSGPASPPVAARARVRYVGVDLARFVAIAGMMGAHLVGLNAFIPGVGEPDHTIAEVVETITGGTAAALFAVLGGLSIVFATRKHLRDGRVGAAVGSVAVRGAVLLVMGFLLGYVDNAIVVILAYYGVAMLLVAPLVAARSWVLGTVAAVLVLASGWLNSLARSALGVRLEGPHSRVQTLLDDPLEMLRILLLTGDYPAVTWAAYLLIGMLVGRALVAATARGELGRASARLAGIGVVLFAVAQLVSNWLLAHLDALGVHAEGSTQSQLARYMLALGSGAPPTTHFWTQLIAAPHSGSFMDLVRTVGISFAVIGLLVLLCDRESVSRRAAAGGDRDLPARALDAVRAAGAAPLTVYSLHIVVTGLLMAPYFSSSAQWDFANPIPWWVLGTGAWALQIAGTLVLGAVLSATGRRGPLEALLSKIVGLAVR